MIAVDTKVFGIIEGPFVIPVRKTVSLDFFRDRGGILAQEPGNIFKRCAFVQFVFDIDTVFKGKVLLVISSQISLNRVSPKYYKPENAVERSVDVYKRQILYTVTSSLRSILMNL